MKKDYRKDTLLSNRDTRNEIIANLFEVKNLFIIIIINIIIL